MKRTLPAWGSWEHPEAPKVQVHSFGTPWCLAKSPTGYVCTRPEGHTGRHAATGTEYVCAVWPEIVVDR